MVAYKVIKNIEIHLHSNPNEGRYYKIKKPEAHILREGDFFIIDERKITIEDTYMYSISYSIKKFKLLKYIIRENGQEIETDVFEPVVYKYLNYRFIYNQKNLGLNIDINYLNKMGYIKNCEKTSKIFSRNEKLKKLGI